MPRFRRAGNGGREAGAGQGQACEQPDGSWQVVQNTPGLPAQAYVLEPPGQPAAAAEQPTVPLQPPGLQPNQPACSSYTAPVTVGGQPRQAVIEACPQPDGSWKITQNTPGLPAQVYQVPPPASSPYPYDYPYPVDYAYPEFFPYWARRALVFWPRAVDRRRAEVPSFPSRLSSRLRARFRPRFWPRLRAGFAAARGGGGGGRR